MFLASDQRCTSSLNRPRMIWKWEVAEFPGEEVRSGG